MTTNSADPYGGLIIFMDLEQIEEHVDEYGSESLSAEAIEWLIMEVKRLRGMPTAHVADSRCSAAA